MRAKLQVAILGFLVLSCGLSCVGYVKSVHKISTSSTPSDNAELSFEFVEDSLRVSVHVATVENTPQINVNLQIKNAGRTPILLSTHNLSMQSSAGADLGSKLVNGKHQPDSVLALLTGDSWLSVVWMLDPDQIDWNVSKPLVLRIGPFAHESNQRTIHMPTIFVFEESIRVSY